MGLRRDIAEFLGWTDIQIGHFGYLTGTTSKVLNPGELGVSDTIPKINLVTLAEVDRILFKDYNLTKFVSGCENRQSKSWEIKYVNEDNTVVAEYSANKSMIRVYRIVISRILGWIKNKAGGD